MREELITKMKETADYIFRHPELPLKEYTSSRALAAFLEQEGFTLEWGLAGFETAFAAQWSNGGDGRPIIGFLAEYDALPGLGQACVPRKEQDGDAGHGCGHNLLGSACAGAACSLKDRMQSENLTGTVRVYGCPAEEIVVGKIRMNEQGIFDDLSVAVTWHPFDRNRVSYDIWQAQDIRNYKFYGTAAHASKHPEAGRSALDAAELMNVSVNYLREHVTDDVRMHYTYTNTDGPANIVSPYASTNYFIRSGKWERTQDATKRVDDCARGAALMTGTKVEIERVTCNKEMKVNRTLAETFYEEMEKIPAPTYSGEETAFAKEISEAAGFDNGGVYFTGLEPLEEKPVPLSIGTDVSDVSHTVPTVMLSAVAMCKGTPLHHWAATAQAGMSIGQKGMIYAAKCMAAGAYRLLKEPELLARAWEEFGRCGAERTEREGNAGKDSRGTRIVLGSASPRRRELLAQMGVDFEVRVSGKEERYTNTEPQEIVKELSLMKAENVAAELLEEMPPAEGYQKELVRDTVVIGADTIVVQDDVILGKPVDEEDAVRMLGRLQGREHWVYTGVAVLELGPDGKKKAASYAVGTKVYVNAMTEQEIRGYVATKDPMDKAGAYGIQGIFAKHIGRIDGDYYNVVGLPVSRVYETLREMGALD